MESSLRKDSSKSRLKLVLLAALVLVFVLAFVFVATYKMNPPSSEETLLVNGHKFSLEVASTQAQQQLGLGKRASMPANHGMLFVFPQPVVECFWMKDMRFPLDMIWLDQYRKVVFMVQNVSPDTYPKTFCPTQTSKYVIELNAGTAQSDGIHDGDTLGF